MEAPSKDACPHSSLSVLGPFIPHLSSRVTCYIYAVQPNGVFTMMSHEEQTQEVGVLNLHEQPYVPRREWRETQ